MKKVLKKVLLTLLCIFPMKALAAGDVTVSPDTITIEKGKQETVIVYLYNIGEGGFTIFSNDFNVATTTLNASYSSGIGSSRGSTEQAEVYVTGENIGTTTLTLIVDEGTKTFDDDDLTGLTRTVTVNVVDKKDEPTPTPTPSPEEKKDNSTPAPENKEESNKNEKKDNPQTGVAIRNCVVVALLLTGSLGYIISIKNKKF